MYAMASQYSIPASGSTASILLPEQCRPVIINFLSALTKLTCNLPKQINNWNASLFNSTCKQSSFWALRKGNCRSWAESELTTSPLKTRILSFLVRSCSYTGSIEENKDFLHSIWLWACCRNLVYAYIRLISRGMTEAKFKGVITKPYNLG